MHVKYLAGIVGAALLMAGCSSSNELSAAGQSVRIVDEQPGAECQLIGTATGKQSNWLSGQHGEERRFYARRSKRSAQPGGSNGR